MTAQVMELLAPRPGDIVLDATAGGAGHGRLICEAIAPNGTYVGIDQDASALAAAAARLDGSLAEGELILLHGNFRHIDDLLCSANLGYIDRALFDVGVSSHQLDTPERGFSYMTDGPLDMRMDADGGGMTAYELLGEWDARDLTAILHDYGEEKWAARIADFIVRRREAGTLPRTGRELAELVKQAIPASARRTGGNPAKRTFQALRVAVNDELGALREGLTAAIRWLRPGGRVVVASFQSLEDRLVKQVFADHAGRCTCPPDLPVCACGSHAYLRVLTKSALRPDADEVAQNPRAKATRLRAAERL
jgi:16S rRNA (cytosine1402-N4)-methyltransferase